MTDYKLYSFVRIVKPVYSAKTKDQLRSVPFYLVEKDSVAQLRDISTNEYGTVIALIRFSTDNGNRWSKVAIHLIKSLSARSSKEER